MDIGQLVGCLLSMHEALGLILSTVETRLKIHVCGPSTWEADAEIHGHPWLYSEFTTSLDYMRPYIKRKKKGHVGTSYSSEKRIDKWIRREGGRKETSGRERDKERIVKAREY